MDLVKLNSHALHLEAEKAAAAHKNSECYLLCVLEAVDARELYLEFGFPSLFKYCTLILNLSPSLSYELIAVIRKSKEVPELRAAVLTGKVSLSKAKKICSVIDESNFEEWIDLARSETSRVIEKCVATANPKQVVKESLEYRTAERLELKLGVSEEWSASLTRVKDLLAQKSGKHVDAEEALLTVMKEYIQRHDPVAKAERALRREYANEHRLQNSMKAQAELDQQVPGPVEELKGAHSNSTRRSPLRRLAVHRVHARDQNQCTHLGSRGRCEEKRWLDIHHVIPVSEGGADRVENLTTLCQAHHRDVHRDSI